MCAVDWTAFFVFSIRLRPTFVRFVCIPSPIIVSNQILKVSRKVGLLAWYVCLFRACRPNERQRAGADLWCAALHTYLPPYVLCIVLKEIKQNILPRLHVSGLLYRRLLSLLEPSLLTVGALKLA